MSSPSQALASVFHKLPTNELQALEKSNFYAPNLEKSNFFRNI